MSDIWSIASMVSRSVAVGTLVMEVMVMVEGGEGEGEGRRNG